MLSSSVENLSARRYNSSIVAGGSRDKDWKNGVVGPKLLLKFLQDRIHTVYIDLLDCLPEPACEVPDGLVFSFEDGLEGADVPFLSDKA